MEECKVKKSLIVFIFLIFLVTIIAILFLTNKISAVDQTYCCEKINAGAWCQNAPATDCKPNYQKQPTSCESTSYCRLGTCVNSQEGTCSSNTPQRVCNDNNGTWFEGKPADIPQCQLGCCLIGDQAAFTTQTNCKSLASKQGLNSSFRTDIKDEITCIASANPQVKGACVIDDGVYRNCTLSTRANCQQIQKTSTGNTIIEFHEGLLCSAETLATNCGPSKSTTCVADKDQVYFLDTCGNLANVYDASKFNDPNYWTNIQDPSSSCNPDSSNANSASCGNCDVFSGSTCKPYQRGNTQQTPTAPQYGNFVCADLSCKYDTNKNGRIEADEIYRQGASWCSNTQGANKNLPGSSYAVLRCFNGEVTTEVCDALRNKICLQNSIPTSSGDFPVANCVVNRWQDCTSVDNKDDCLNTDQRDCQWINLTSATDAEGNAMKVDSNGTLVQGEGKSAACVPKYAPGFNFWNTTEDTSVVNPEKICAQASQTCVVTFTRNTVLGAIGVADWTCDGNCPCVGLKKGDKIPGGIAGISQWVNQRMGMCVSLGDCGNSTNYIGVPGYQNKNTVVIP